MWLKGQIPLLVVIGIFCVFTVYNFSLNPLPSSPEQQWWNAGTWFLGSLAGALVGWWVGWKAACWQFKKAHPGQSKVN